MQGPPHELDIQNGAVYAKTLLHRGIKYGPYPVELTKDPVDKQFAWEVSAQTLSLIKEKSNYPKSLLVALEKLRAHFDVSVSPYIIYIA